MNGVVDGFVVIGIVIVVGYLLGRSGLLGPGSVEVLSRLAFFVASPALLFVTLAQADVRAVFSEALVVTAVSSSVACLLYLPVGLLRRRPPGETAVGSMASGYVNAGNLGIPIATYALGNAAEVAPVMLFQLTVLAPLFSTVLDLTSARADGERPPLLRTLTAPLRNPIALASAAGLLVSATGLQVPGAVLAPVELIGNLAVPAMLLAFGLSLRGAPWPGAGDGAPSLVAVMLLKNLVQPALALALGLLLGLSTTRSLRARAPQGRGAPGVEPAGRGELADRGRVPAITVGAPAAVVPGPPRDVDAATTQVGPSCRPAAAGQGARAWVCCPRTPKRGGRSAPRTGLVGVRRLPCVGGRRPAPVPHHLWRVRRRLGGGRRAHCGSCHLTFDSIALFDAHRAGERCARATGARPRADQNGIWREPVTGRRRTG